MSVRGGFFEAKQNSIDCNHEIYSVATNAYSSYKDLKLFR
jgi:hypothetical protein